MRSLLLTGCLACAAALSAAAPKAHADSFSYNFSFAEPAIGIYQFTYTSPTLITTDEAGLTPESCSALGAPCTSISILAASGEIKISGTNSADITGLPASFFEVGTNSYDFAEMTITENAGANPVPEPSSLALLGTGVLGVAETVRRRRRVS